MTSLLSTVVSPSPSTPSSAPTFTFRSSSATRRRARSRHDSTPTAGQPRCLAEGNASSSTTAFRAPRRRERQEVQMYAEPATAAAAGVGEVDHACPRLLLSPTPAPTHCRIQSRRRAVLLGWRWSLLDSYIDISRFSKDTRRVSWNGRAG